jgi:uncharacterized protein (TIGR02099 family)
LAGAAAFILVLFTAAVLWLRYVALPDVDRYRPEILASIEKASGMAVGVTAIRGGWGGLRPVLSLEGVSINDRAGRAAFRLERAEATLSWWSLFLGEIRFHDLDFHRPDLVLRRGADGVIYLADKPINAAGPGGDGAFTEWLLAQPRLGIHDATLTWRDDFGGAPEVRLAGVEIAVAKSRGRHRAALTAVPPRSLATRIDLRAEVQLVREGDRWRARGEAYAEALNADLARLRNHLPVPETLRSGVGSARLWLAFTPQGITEATGDVNMRDARVQLDADALPLQLASLSGRAIYRADPEGFSLTTEQLRFRLASGAEASPGRFSVTRTAPAGAAPRVEFQADNIDLKIAATLVDYFPLPREIKGQVLRFAPRGRIADARIAWTEGAKAYSVNGRFEALAINAVDAYPGASGLSGSIEGTEAGGILKVESRGAAFEAQRIFPASLALDQLDAQARWRHVGSALEVQVERARVANADGTLEFSGTWRAAPPREAGPSPGIVDFKGTLERVVVKRVPAYLPNVIAGTREWLEKALAGGEISAGRFELKGDLYDFPFGGQAPGRFLLEARARNGRLVYHPEWPSIDAIDGLVRFDNRSMEIRAQRGAIFSSAVRGASAVIADLGARPAVLVIDGEVDTTGADTMRFLRESPLVNGPGAFTRAIAVEGPGRLKLHLDIPLRGAEAIRVAGEYQLAGATATSGQTIAMRDMRGKLAFTERGVNAPELVGTMFGGPATLALATEPGSRVLATIEGRIDVEALRPYVPEPIARRLSGSTQWKARVLSGAQGTEIGLATDLVGLASRLPAPLEKAADETRSLTIQLAGIGTDTELVNAALSGGVFWRSVRRGDGEARAAQLAIKMGEPIAQEPARDGLWLYGSAEALDVDAWMAVFPEASRGNAPAASTAPPLGLRGIDMRLGRVRYAGRELAKVAAKLEHAGEEWRGTLDSPIIAGTVQWRSEGRGHLTARLTRLAIPEARPDTAASQAPSQDPPALDVVAERFDFRGRTLGKLEIKADYARPDAAGQAPAGGEEWRIEKLDITSPHAQWRSTGSWRRTGAGALTSMTVGLEVPSLNGLLGQFGYGDYVTRGIGRLEGKLAWPGHPHDFSTSILSGNLEVRAQRGQFAKLEPGAGKLLGLLSLQSLPRRVTLDFRDIFSDGFAFESIEGSVKIARGLMLADNFAISGPSALVSLSGEVSLPQETQTLTLRVVPEMGESAAVAATVLGTPVLGLSTLLISKLLSNPIGKVVAYEYLVTGSWDNPVVTKLSAPPPPPAKAATAEAQK